MNRTEFIDKHGYTKKELKKMVKKDLIDLILTKQDILFNCIIDLERWKKDSLNWRKAHNMMIDLVQDIPLEKTDTALAMLKKMKTVKKVPDTEEDLESEDDC